VPRFSRSEVPQTGRSSCPGETGATVSAGGPSFRGLPLVRESSAVPQTGRSSCPGETGAAVSAGGPQTVRKKNDGHRFSRVIQTCEQCEQSESEKDRSLWSSCFAREKMRPHFPRVVQGANGPSMNDGRSVLSFLCPGEEVFGVLASGRSGVCQGCRAEAHGRNGRRSFAGHVSAHAFFLYFCSAFSSLTVTIIII